MEKWIEFIQHHAVHAHWFLFGASLLAGMNIPISIDLLMIIGAILAATTFGASVPKLFFALYLGCAISAWIAYWMGKKLGPSLLKLSFFSKFVSAARIETMRKFYEKRGFMAFVIGRFIPFGVRNALYMSSGMTGLSFRKFVLRDGIACSLWSLVSFTLYYMLGKNIPVLYSHVKTANLFIFLAFGVTLITIFWYKKKKKAKEENV